MLSEGRRKPTQSLNDTLLAQLERLADPKLTGEALEEERQRARTMAELAQAAIAQQRLELDAKNAETSARAEPPGTTPPTPGGDGSRREPDGTAPTAEETASNELDDESEALEKRSSGKAIAAADRAFQLVTPTTTRPRKRVVERAPVAHKTPRHGTATPESTIRAAKAEQQPDQTPEDAPERKATPTRGAGRPKRGPQEAKPQRRRRRRLRRQNAQVRAWGPKSRAQRRRPNRSQSQRQAGNRCRQRPGGKSPHHSRNSSTNPWSTSERTARPGGCSNQS